MARAKNAENLAPVTGGITPDLREAIEDYRWSARQTVSEVVREALESWSVGKGIWTPPAESTDDNSDDAAKVAEAQTDQGKADQVAKDATEAKAKADADKADKPKTPARSTSR